MARRKAHHELGSTAAAPGPESNIAIYTAGTGVVEASVPEERVGHDCNPHEPQVQERLAQGTLAFFLACHVSLSDRCIIPA